MRKNKKKHTHFSFPQNQRTDPWEKAEPAEMMRIQRMTELSHSLDRVALDPSADSTGTQSNENGSITRYIHIKHADSTVKIFRETTV